MKAPKKILWLSDYNGFTGFCTVATNIKKELKKYFGNNIQLDIVAINYHGEEYNEPDGTRVISAVKSATKHDDFGRFGFLKILQDTDDYDGVFILQDLGVITVIVELLQYIKDKKKKEGKKLFKSIFYFPVDWELSPELTKGLEFFDLLVAYTEYGRNQILRLRPELRPKLKVIPHGNNGEHFYPISPEEKAEFRKSYFGDNCDKFIITNINRNQPRKDIATTIFAFIEAKRMWDEAKIPQKPFLYLHMNPKDPMGWDLRFVLSQTDLVEGVDYKLLEQDMADKGAKIGILNKIYNASDVYLTTTLGEGWGLTLTEAMATKTPVICPLSTSFIEMTENGKNVYPLIEFLPTCSIFDNTIRKQCVIEEVAETIVHVAKGMNCLLGESGFQEAHGQKLENAYKWCKSIEWDAVCKRWVEYFKEVY